MFFRFFVQFTLPYTMEVWQDKDFTVHYITQIFKKILHTLHTYVHKLHACTYPPHTHSNCIKTYAHTHVYAQAYTHIRTYIHTAMPFLHSLTFFLPNLSATIPHTGLPMRNPKNTTCTCIKTNRSCDQDGYRSNGGFLDTTQVPFTLQSSR